MWLVSVEVSARLDTTGHGFGSHSLHYRVWHWTNYLHYYGTKGLRNGK